MQSPKIHTLILDDDPIIRLGLSEIIKTYGPFREAGSIAEARKFINTEPFQVALVDMKLSHEMGLEILAELKRKKIHVIVMSSEEDENIIEKAYALGADHYLTKRQFRKSLSPIMEKFIHGLELNTFDQFFAQDFITQDPILKNRIIDICQIDSRNKAILITGETGVGKSHIAKLIHRFNYSSDKPFVHLNCSEIPENLIESELFGFQKGSFTGANENKIGKLQLANGGTLFLDEVGTMPLIMQQKLLKAIEEKSFYPLGSSRIQQCEFTLITATCDDLFEKIANKEFRKDFFFRISGVNLDIPPLRSRPQDISLLVKNLLKNQSRKVILKDDALAALESHHWPGNVRELKKYLELISLKNKGIFTREDLPAFLNLENSKNEIISEFQIQYIRQHGLRSYFDLVESTMVNKLIDIHQGKITACIADLKISNSSFYRILNGLKQ